MTTFIAKSKIGKFGRVAMNPTGPDAAVPPVLTVQGQDLDELRHGLAYLGADVVHLGRGPFRSRMRLVQLGPVQVLEVTTNSPMHSFGWRPNTFGFNLITPANLGVSVMRRPLQPYQIATVGPPGEWDHVAALPLRQFCCVTVDAEVFRAAAATWCGHDRADRFASPVLTPGRAAFRSLAACVRQCFTLVQAAGADAERLGHRCIEALLRVTFPSGRAEDARRAVNHRRVLSQAVDYMAAHLEERLSLLEICREVDASERTVRGAFVEVFGVSPMEYFKARKLSAMHQVLRQAMPGAASVGDIASSWGFSHPGNFAADYRRMFGELPSTTLKSIRRPKRISAW